MHKVYRHNEYYDRNIKMKQNKKYSNGDLLINNHTKYQQISPMNAQCLTKEQLDISELKDKMYSGT